MDTYSVKSTEISRYLEGINDKWRNQFYYSALKKHASGKVVLDVGSGTGILSFYALNFGAEFVYAVEINEEMAKITDAVLSSKFDRSRFKVINANFWTKDIDNKIDRPVDLLVTETVGPGLFDQGMFHTWTSVRPFANSNMISIPDSLSIDLWEYYTDLSDKKLSVQNSVSELITSNVIDFDFLTALVDIDNNIYQEQKTGQHEWIKVSDLAKPDGIVENIFQFGYENLPQIVYSEDVYPTHVRPIVETMINIEKPLSAVLINKISFEEETLYLYQATQGMPWVFAPFFYIDTIGNYKLTYTNYELKNMSKFEWLIE